MTPRAYKDSTYRRFFAAAAYLCAVGLLAIVSARMGLSHYYGTAAKRGSDRAGVEAISYDPGNPEGYKHRGLLMLRNGKFSEAAADLQHAIELHENDFLLWLRFGDALSGGKDLDGARIAYEKAVSLAPNYAEPNWHLGLFLLRTGEPEDGFTFLRKAAARDTTLYPEILELARGQYPENPEAIERAVGPATLTARKAMARYLIEHDLMTDSVRSLLIGKELIDTEKDAFIRQLIDKKNVRAAYEAWLTKTGPAAAKTAENGPVFDGGFESITETDDSGFGWQVDRRSSGIAVAVDDQVFYRGSRSLNIRFDGQVEAGRRLVSQLVVLEPNRNYRLNFAVLCSQFTSGGGLPVVVVSTGDPAASVARSKPIMATDNQWVSYTVQFKTGNETAVVVSLQREACDTAPCPIFGEMSLDDVSIGQ